MISSGY